MATSFDIECSNAQAVEIGRQLALIGDQIEKKYNMTQALVIVIGRKRAGQMHRAARAMLGNRHLDLGLFSVFQLWIDYYT